MYFFLFHVLQKYYEQNGLEKWGDQIISTVSIACVCFVVALYGYIAT